MDRRDVTGLWLGEFRYDDPWQGDPVRFVAIIQEVASHISGSTREPNTVGASSSELQAHLHGKRSDHQVEFSKTYDGASDAAHRVDYSGRISDDGTLLAGHWCLEDLTGSFRMTRELLDEEVVSDEAVASIFAELLV